MILDENGMLNIEFKDVFNLTLNGDFEDIPRNAVVAKITENIFSLNTTKTFRVILGTPIYSNDNEFLLNNNAPDYETKKPILAIGKSQNVNYIVLYTDKDYVVSNREEFIQVLEELGAEFLEKLDNQIAHKTLVSKID